MEIERKWMVNGWPEQPLPLKEEFAMRQGYISVRPTVRIREEAMTGGETKYILCFKSGSGLAREEIEREIDKELFTRLEEKIIGKPLIPKLRRSYQLPDGMVLLDDVAEQLPIVFDDPEEDTIGGYVFGLLGRKPEIGDAVEISGYSFKVLRTEGFRVVRVLAAKLPQEQKQKEEQQDE